MTAVEWLLATLEQKSIIDLDSVDSNKYYDIIEQAKQMEIAQRNNLIDDIDFDLMMMEDYAHGDVGTAITKLRIKLGELIKR